MEIRGRRSGVAYRLGIGAIALAASACVGTAPPQPTVVPDDARGQPATTEPRAPVAADTARTALETGPEDARSARLPAIPSSTGPIDLQVQYPRARQRLTAADSNFIFGSVGTGDAQLEIDEVPVPVHANGAFLAWLAVPEATRGDTAVYRLTARQDTQRVELELPVRLPYDPRRASERPALDTEGFEQMRERWVLPGEPVELLIRGEPGLSVWLEAGEVRFPLSPRPDAGVPVGRYGITVDAAELRNAACDAGSAAGACRHASTELASDTNRVARTLPVDTLALGLVATDGRDTIRAEGDLALGWLSPDDLPAVDLVEAPDPINGLSGVVVGRPTPSGPYRWRFPNGTRARVSGRLGDRLRLRLGDDLDAWVLAEDAQWVDGISASPAQVYDVRVEPGPDRLTVRVGVSSTLPIQVSQSDDNTLHLTLFGALGETSRITYGEGDPLIASMEWVQLPGQRYRLTLRLRESVWGHRAAWVSGQSRTYEGPRGERGPEQDGGIVLRFEVRRAPDIDARRPLLGRRVAVDPGHPGGGSRGPTGLFEGDANLAIARQLVRMLEGAGAEPVLIRTDGNAVGLYERTRRAVDAGAELFVSIHNNALPDGVRPFGREGTSTYYYHPHARALALAVQEGLLLEMGLRDLGIRWGDLAVARMPWMPSVLAEGAFMMMPRHEAALRTPGFQARYARGVLRGLESFLRSRAREDQ
jgi:N-acetylmuramoyl-L-alanine amidase